MRPGGPSVVLTACVLLEAPRVFVTGLIQNSGIEREGEGLDKAGKGLCLDILLGHKGCFGFAFLFGRG